ncbi:uncharacterized protein LOC130903533 [Diorhabda carinulata]|uniref:uncharacterized protein LOC130903533 n=1 Tax=Diorhabda carinulata TaxID=1163345 RepID=UPI0025A12E1F|nr:uncharacterized protein LOC130903533 [Diorhabda carinulata]
MALPTAILLSGIDTTQLEEIADKIETTNDLQHGLDDLKKGKGVMALPFVKTRNSDSGIGSSDSEVSRTPSPYNINLINEIEEKNKIDLVNTVAKKEEGDNNVLHEDDNESETSSDYCPDIPMDSVEWMTAINNSADKLIYCMNVIDRLESKFAMFSQSNCPQGHIYSPLDPKIIYDNRDILDLASNLRRNVWQSPLAHAQADATTKFQNEPIAKEMASPRTTEKCKIEGCNYNEPIYD